MVYYKALSLLSDVFGAGVNRNEFGHNECFTQTMLFRYNHCVLSLWIQLNIQILRNVHTYIHTYVRTYVRTYIRISFQDRRLLACVFEVFGGISIFALQFNLLDA
jgi:hypothetical protein